MRASSLSRFSSTAADPTAEDARRNGSWRCVMFEDLLPGERFTFPDSLGWYIYVKVDATTARLVSAESETAADFTVRPEAVVIRVNEAFE